MTDRKEVITYAKYRSITFLSNHKQHLDRMHQCAKYQDPRQFHSEMRVWKPMWLKDSRSWPRSTRMRVWIPMWLKDSRSWPRSTRMRVWIPLWLKDSRSWPRSTRMRVWIPMFTTMCLKCRSKLTSKLKAMSSFSQSMFQSVNLNGLVQL